MQLLHSREVRRLHDEGLVLLQGVLSVKALLELREFGATARGRMDR